MVIKSEGFRAALILGLVLNAIFFSALWGGKTLLTSSWDAPSVMPAGAFSTDRVPPHVSRTPDPGAPAWQTEPWFEIIAKQYWVEHRLPLWNPSSAYGTPLAAAMQPQPFFPLAMLLSLHTTAWTYNLFIVARLLLAGLLTFFFARLFLRFAPSLFAALTFMLTGYFIVYLNMPHLSAEVLLPGFFWTFERLLRKNTWAAGIPLAIMVFVCFIGGMPESLFLAVAFACLYFVLRLAFTPEFRAQWFTRSCKLSAAVAGGFALSAFLLLPFLEFIRISHDTHQAANISGIVPGLAVDDDKRATVQYLLPLIFGPVNNSIFSGLSGWTGLRAYWGVTPCLFALAAIFFWARRNRSYPRPLKFLTAFFSITLTLMILKRFGSPAINWIGMLPIGDMIVFVKYQEPLMALCVAMLAGIGFSLLVELRPKTSFMIAVALVLLGLMLGLSAWSLPRVLQLGHLSYVYYLIVFSGALVVLAALFLVIMRPRQPWLAVSFISLLTVELCFNFIVPSFYIFNPLPSVQRSPYEGAPYIDFLKMRETGHYRIFGRDGVLYPNWSGVFGLDDVRSLDALYYRPYINFIRSFLLRAGDENRMNGDLADRFTGSGDGYNYAFDSETEKRFLVLSSIKYIVGISELGVSSKIVDEIIGQHRAENLWGFGRDIFQIADGKSALGLFQHPPSRQVGYKTIIDPKQPFFEGVAAIKRGAEDKSSGIEFLLVIRSGDKTEKLFSTFLNPKEVSADRSGRPFRLDLSHYAGKEVELLFSTDTGPSKNNAYGWAGWAKLNFAPASPSSAETPAEFKRVYEKEVNVHEVSDILPRASLFRAVEILPEAEVLTRLKDPTFDLRSTLIVSKESVTEDQINTLRLLNSGPSKTYQPAVISKYDSQRVRIEADNATPAVLMLNDSNYPGWRAYLNGSPVPIFKANYLFRGVFLPVGRNVVEFSYEPTSFRAGAIISAGTLALLSAWGIIGLLQGRKRKMDVRLISNP